jgi:rubrerythrin
MIQCLAVVPGDILMELKGSMTEKSLLAAFAGESQARTRYTFFASQAKKEGLEQISAIFIETADNEKEHAALFFNYLQGGEAQITASYPAGTVGSTTQNLRSAAEGERMEWGTLYPGFADVAEKEGFKDIASIFRRVALVEDKHEKRYLKLLANMESGQVFRRANPVQWKCRNCGHVLTSTGAPTKCPVCLHDQAYFELFVETY